MIGFPPAKINIGLQITGKRPDGYHNIETMMFPLPLTDILEIIPGQNPQDQFIQTGINLQGNPADNLVMKALHSLRSEYQLPFVNIHLHKIVPAGAGLGGGSSDAAIAINLLNSLFDLGIPSGKRKEIASRIGSDCPFFIESKPAMATGRGEILTPFPISLSGYTLLLIIPPVHVSTAEAYSGIQINPSPINLTESLKAGIRTWKDTVVNDFEMHIFAKYPLLKQIKDKLYAKGALYASMSGSGSALYGLFEDDIATEAFRQQGIVHKFQL
jgi:4-diphosphocytidyl-2-C-methyl-D-erythritol kinase